VTTIKLTVNAQPVTATIEPRLHLADFLRGQLGLTGTHLGCEQGVCGACTVLIDGKPMRSCITFAIACDGADITSIEGFDDDPLMSRLREAFSAHHALQCGFCTPGMLIAARDLIQRSGECDERKIREELSGNLCRCTGYMGIVAAVKEVAKGHRPGAQKSQISVAVSNRPSAIGPDVTRSAPARGAPQTDRSATAEGWTQVVERIEVPIDPDTTWKLLKDVRRISSCVPGAMIDDFDGTNLRGRMVVKFGPIKANFFGNGTVSYSDDAHEGILQGHGRDTLTGSQARGEIAYRLIPGAAAPSTIEIEIRYRISGALAQFSRTTLVRNFVGRMASMFAENLARIADPGRSAEPPRGFNVFTVAFSAVLQSLRGLLKR
jgi:carbon-monoxide dehydrogenase small subunit